MELNIKISQRKIKKGKISYRSRLTRTNRVLFINLTMFSNVQILTVDNQEEAIKLKKL